MTRFFATFAIAFLGVVQHAHAFCEPGVVETCLVNGAPGTRTCGDNAQFGPCMPDNPEPVPTGQCFPKYRILSVVYGPPGRTGGGASTTIYGSQSSFGTTTSSSHGFKSSYTVSATTSLGFLFKGSGDWSFGYARNTIDTAATDIRKSSSTTITDDGHASDGIDHDQDRIWLWLGPTLDVAMPNLTTVHWTFNNAAPMHVDYVYVAELKNPAIMRSSQRAKLESFGITTADYAEILKADPFAYGPAPIDTNRYKILNTTFPYRPPFSPTTGATTIEATITHTVTNTTSTTVSNEYSVGMTYSAGLDLPVFKQSLELDNKWTWTDTNFRSTSQGATESATVRIRQPSFGYTGPTDIAVYYDMIYKTFMFAFYAPGVAPSVHGVIISDSDAPVAGKEVAVVADGVTYRSFTDDAGEFRIFGPPKSATMRLRTGRTEMSVAHSSAPVVISVP